jgi:hypothetical protein
MEARKENQEFELLCQQLNDDQVLEDYKKCNDNYRPALIPRILGWFMVTAGNVVYGFKASYLKFRAVEVIARVPYHSWDSAMFTLQTLFYSNEKKAMELSKIAEFSRIAAENETMHVIVISQLAKKEHKRAGVIRHTLIPMLFAFFYFWMSYVLYMIKPRYSYQLNYLFEQHAFDSYSQFLRDEGEELKKKTIDSEFLRWYGRNPVNQYEFFLSVRNDEIIHRNTSIREIERVESL